MEMATEAISKVKKWRENKISIYRIAKELGVVWVTVKRWENGNVEPSYQVAQKILETEIKK